MTTMGILARIRRLVLANLRDLVEKSEDPGVGLLEFAEEVETCCGEVRAELADASNAAARLERQLLEKRAEARLWGRKARSAVRQGSDDLAREALRRKAGAEAIGAHLAIQLREQLELAGALGKTAEDLSAKLEETRRRRDELLAGSSRAASAARVGETLRSRALWAGDPSVERLAEEIVERLSRAEAYQGLFNSSLEAELRRLRPKAGIEAELKKIKEEGAKGKRPAK